MFTETLPSGRVRAGFRVAGRKVTKTFDYAYEAEAWATAAEAQATAAAAIVTQPAVQMGQPLVAVPDIPARPDAPTITAHGEAWLARRGYLAKATVNFYGAQVRGIATTPLGAVRIDQPRKSDVEAWLTWQLDAGVPRPTVNARLKVLRMVCQDALADGLADRDPTAGLKYLPTEARPDRVLDQDEQARLIAHASPDLALMALLALDAGLRWEEAAAVSVDSIQGDFLVVHQVIERDSRKVRGYTKGGKPRTIPMTHRLMAALAPVVEAARAERGPHALLVTSPEGQPLDYYNWRLRAWRPTCRAARLNPRPRFHDLRHTYGSGLAAGNVPRHEIATLLGHADEKTTARYIHAGADGHRLALVRAALAG
jgi:integrase